MRWLSAALVGLVALAACRTPGAVGDPAVVAHPTPESRSAVAQAVSRALSGRQVDVDDDALTTTGVLVIERGQIRDPSRMLHGRDPGDPGATERFHLVMQGERCFLVHDRTDRAYELMGTTCRPR